MPLILIVDDSETHRKQLQAELSQAHYEVLEAADGVQGLEVVEAHPQIDLILCDVNMPRMSGLMMVEKLRAKREGKNIPVMMLTTEADPALKERGKAAGVSAWAIKPFDAKKVIVAIEKLIKKGVQAPYG